MIKCLKSYIWRKKVLTKYKGKKIVRKEKFDYNLLVDTAILLGEIMLKNGAETKRVEDAMDKLLRTTKMKHIEAVVMTTSIIVTLSDPSIEHITAVSRIHDRVTNLNKVNLANLAVKKYCNKEIELEELFQELKRIKKVEQYNNYLKAIGLILVPPAFTIMLNGTYLDAISALVCGILITILNKAFSYVKINDFIKNSILVMIVSFAASLLSKLINSDVQSVVVGFIMPYVPGIAITNAARDTFNAEYMSVAARLLDAIIQALAVALGVFVGLYMSNILLK